VVLLIAFTAVVGMFLSVAGASPLAAFLFGILGIALAHAGSGQGHDTLTWIKRGAEDAP
jgi:heme O synthase-like polyprenyltransferase